MYEPTGHEVPPAIANLDPIEAMRFELLSKSGQSTTECQLRLLANFNPLPLAYEPPLLPQKLQWEDAILDFVKGGQWPSLDAQFSLLHAAGDSAFVDNHRSEVQLRHFYDELTKLLPSI